MPRTFTETWLRSLKPAEIRQDFTEAGRRGFQLRVWPGGEKTFVLRYHDGARSRVMTFGAWPVMSLAEAHEEHAAARRLLTRGLDPIEERKREAKARAVRDQHDRKSKATTVRNVIAEWAWHYARRHRKRPREAVRLLEVNVGKPWKGRPVGELTKRDAVLLLDRIVARGSNVMARRIRSLGLQVFTHAVARDLTTVNPFLGVPLPGVDEQPKDRKLDAAELRTFWLALDRTDIEMSRPVRLALKLIAVTAQRPGEVAEAPWSEFDLAAKVWTIPPERSKNGKAHQVPLSDLALELLADLQALAKDRPHLLPSVHSKLKRDESLSVRALSRALRNNIDDDSELLFDLPAFTPHDLRRSAASGMTALGIPRLHVAKILGHADTDITSVYDVHDYASEKRTALQTWADELRALIAGKKRKVVPIGRPRRV